MSHFDRRIRRYNQTRPLNDYFLYMIGNKKSVKIADLGSGPYPITGQTLDGVDIKVYWSDARGFDNFWTNHKSIPLFPIEVQDMEALTYEDDFFDIVHCVNALDHTKNAEQALKEMIRVCKPGGWIYIDCSLNQHSVRRKKHYWDAKPDGTFTNETGSFSLQDYGFYIEYIDLGGEPQYNRIIGTKCCQ